MQNSKAQTSFEFLLILSVAILVLVIIAVISQGHVTTVQNIKDDTDAKNSLMDLSSAAKEVYAQGEGSKKKVYIQLPSTYDADKSFVSNKSIRINAAGTDHVSIENFNVRGYLPSTSGGHWVWVVSEGNRVRIGDAMMELDKNRIFLVMDSNSTASTSFNVKNIWIGDIGITTSTIWNNYEVTMDGVPVSFSINVGNIYPITLEFVSSADSGGVYTGQIILVATDDIGNTEDVNVPVTIDVIPYTEPPQTEDLLGPLITNVFQDQMPAIKNQPLTIFVNTSDVLTGNNTIENCEIDADNADNWQDMLPSDGAYDQTIELTVHNYTDGFSLGPHAIRAKCTDVVNNIGPTAYYYFNVSEADMIGPIVIQMNHTEWPTTLTNISIGGTVTDEYTGNSNIKSCNIKIDSGIWLPLSAEDGVWDSPYENFIYNIGSMSVGYHNIYYQCTDELDNVGGIYNDSFGIIDVDLMLVLDRSGSMSSYVTYMYSNGYVSASSTGWSWVKSLSITQKNGDYANLTVETRASLSGCTVDYNATINGVGVASGSRKSTYYGSQTTLINISEYEPPFTIDLWLRRDMSGCTAYNHYFYLRQYPTKMKAVQDASKSFLDIAGNNIQAGLVSYSTSSTTDELLAEMNPANQETLKDAIDSIYPNGNTCIQCGLQSAANELVSARARPEATKIIVLLTDGQANVGNSVTGAVYCRDRNITVYTIGFGYDVDETELTNIALLTHGEYYFAPNTETLNAIFQGIGK
ncbi:MAG: VWA domain-containing protein [Candidatus Micrarchaeota archaeon]